MKTSELTGAALDWAVAKCAHIPLRHYSKKYGCIVSHNCEDDVPVTPGYEYSPSTNWAQGGPIIEREKIDLCWSPSRVSCMATVSALWPRELDCGLRCVSVHGPTSLVAAMRAFVASKLGDEVDVPKELA